MCYSLPLQNTSKSRIFQAKKARIDLIRASNRLLLMDSQSFERCVVETLVEIIERGGLKHDPTAKKAWPYKKAAGRTWQAIRSDDTSQKLTIRDAHALAQVLGINMSQLFALVETQDLQKALNQVPNSTETSSQKISPQEKAEIPLENQRETVPADAENS